MSAIHDPITGQFKSTSFEEKYPTGRKHCCDCKRWRHIIDFTVHTWCDFSKTVPYKLLAYCKRCANIRKRRRDIKCRRQELYGQGRGEFSASGFLRYLKPHTKRLPACKTSAIFINGRRLMGAELRALNRWRSGEAKTIRLGTADNWAMRFDLPFWEIEEEAAKMAV